MYARVEHLPTLERTSIGEGYIQFQVRVCSSKCFGQLVPNNFGMPFQFKNSLIQYLCVQALKRKITIHDVSSSSSLSTILRTLLPTFIVVEFGKDVPILAALDCFISLTFVGFGLVFTIVSRSGRSWSIAS